MCSIVRVSIRGGAGDDPLERGVELRQRRLGEEPQAAEVHGEDRDVGARERDAPRRREERPVAAEDDDQVDLGRQRVGG